MNEVIKDALIYGTGYMMDGNHVSYRDMVTETKCKKCQGIMKPSKYLQQTYTGLPDFPGDNHPVTMSPGGPVDCLKCCECGHSETI